MNLDMSNLSWKTLAGALGLLATGAYCIHEGRDDLAAGLISLAVATIGQRWAVKKVADKVDIAFSAVADLHEKMDIVHAQVALAAEKERAGTNTPGPVEVVVVNPPDRPVPNRPVETGGEGI